MNTDPRDWARRLEELREEERLRPFHCPVVVLSERDAARARAAGLPESSFVVQAEDAS